MNRMLFFKRSPKKRSLCFLLLCLFCLSFSSVFSNTADYGLENKTGLAESRQLISNLENWLAGTMLGEHTLMYYFAITQPEFSEYVQVNGIEKIKIEFFWQHHSGNPVRLVATAEIDWLNDPINIENWATTIPDVDTGNGRYLLQITINEEECGQKVEAPLVDESVINEQLDAEEETESESPIALEYACGDVYSYDDLNTNALTFVNVGNILKVGGFPILVQTIDGGNGTFSGTGIIPLPFGKSVIQVAFNNVSVNEDSIIYDGEVYGVQDNPVNYPDFSVDTIPLNIGGDICLPPPPPPGYNSEGVDEVTGLDTWGFDPETGLHSETGTIYDPNGFDREGNHVSTGSTYNEAGCNREGFTEGGSPCDPSGT